MYRRAADFKKQRERRDGAWIRDREADMIKKDPHFSLLSLYLVCFFGFSLLRVCYGLKPPAQLSYGGPFYYVLIY